MKINTITNQIYINNKKTNFSAKKDKKTHALPQQSGFTPAEKLVPAMMALAGLAMLNSCTETDKNYNELQNLKEEGFEEFANLEKNLAKIDEKTFVLSSEKDSVVKETPAYKYIHVRYQNYGHTHVFGEITRKSDNKTMKFINAYENGEITSSTLKDTKTGQKYYVTYENGKYKEVHDENGIPLHGRIKRFVVTCLVLMSVYGVGIVVQNKLSNKR